MRARATATSRDMARVDARARPDDGVLPRLSPRPSRTAARSPTSPPARRVTDEGRAAARSCRASRSRGATRSSCSRPASRRSRPAASRSPGDRRSCRTSTSRPSCGPALTSATRGALSLDGFGDGVIVDTPRRPADEARRQPRASRGLGGSLPWMQARILDLYDPQRSREPHVRGAAGELGRDRRAAACAAARPAVARDAAADRSPTIAALLARIAARHDLRVVYPRTARAHARVSRPRSSSYGRAARAASSISRARTSSSRSTPIRSARGPMAAAWARARRARADAPRAAA